jgi:hypothetical protein
MKYFRERHNLKSDYSGYQEVSDSFRKRLSTVCNAYIAYGTIGIGQEGFWIQDDILEHELAINLLESNIKTIVSTGNYDMVFEAIEIYLNVAREYAYKSFHERILPDIQRAFDLSGSVYFVNKEGQINLRVEQPFAENLEETKEILSVSKKSYELFFDTVGKLITRRDKPENIVKDIFVAFENYLKEKTGEKDFDKCVSYLEKRGIIDKHQKKLLDQLYVYRSDAFKVTHAGASKIPDEISALWFVETVIAQLKYLDNKFKQGKQNI